MHPILFARGPFIIYSYGFFYGLGLVVAMVIVEFRARRLGLDAGKVLDLCILSVAAILVGARLFYVLQFPASFAARPLDALAIWRGGQVLYGGLLLSVPVAIWYAKRHGLGVEALGDAFAPAIPSGIAIGRIGCLLNGCCYGARTGSWGVEFPKLYSARDGLVGSPAFVRHVELGWIDSSATHSLPVHPAQLYESAAMLAIAGAIVLLGRSERMRGSLLWTFAGMYAVARFAIEFLRGDNLPWLGPLTFSQVVSILVALGSAGVLGVRLRARPPGVRPLHSSRRADTMPS